MDLGNTIKKIRKNKGFTQDQFATICGISQTYLSQIENNQKEPNLSILKTIAEKLSLPLPILFFQSLTEDDVHPEKKEFFNAIGPQLNK